MQTIGCYLLTWSEINADQHRDRITFDAEPETYTPWSYHPKTLTVPDGWSVAQSKAGPIELYNERGEHVAIVRVARHGKSVECADSHGCRWLALGDTDSHPCCPTCGHSLGLAKGAQ